MPSSAKTKQRGASPTIRIVWGVLCSLSSIDKDRNNISLFNVIDQVNVPKKDLLKAHKQNKKGLIIPIQHEIVFLCRRLVSPALCNELVSIDVHVSLIDVNGTILVELLVPVQFSAGQRNMTCRVSRKDIKVSDFGDYEYRVSAIDNKGRAVADFAIPFLVQEV